MATDLNMEKYDLDYTKQVQDSSNFYKGVVIDISRPNTSKDQMLDVYAKWIDTYDDTFLSGGYTGPVLTAKYAADTWPKEQRSKVRILDIGCGTGLGAVELRKHGFERIDGLDPSEPMLNKAKERKLYENYLLEYLTADKINVSDNTYDAITGSGCFSEGHVPSEALREMIRLVRPGGYITLTTRLLLIETSDYYKDLEPLMEQLEKEGKWKKIARDIWPRFYVDKEALVYHYQVL